MTKVVVPSGALGLNYDKLALEKAIAGKPDIIAIDGGSTDSGPSYLGRGVSKYSKSSTKIEWKGLMQARAKANVPLVIGTAGTCGADSAVDWLVDITKEIAAELKQDLKIAILKSSQPKERIINALKAGKITTLTPAPDIDEDSIEQFENIVALAGVEQIQMAIETGADIIIAGRTTDTAIIAALPIMQHCHVGAAWHGAKVAECGALCATHPQSGVITVNFDDDGFTITPMADEAMATPHTVSAHMLYENSDPFILFEPGGHLDVTDAKYQSVDQKSVRATGAKWVPSNKYTVKLEAAQITGYQVMLMCLVRDPHYVDNIVAWTSDISELCCKKVNDRLTIDQNDFDIELRLIGKNATLGDIDKDTASASEVGVMGIVTAKTATLALEVGKILNPYLLHHPLTQYEEVPTFAFPFSPAELDIGPVYEFCLNHVMELDDPMDAFSLNVIEVNCANT